MRKTALIVVTLVVTSGLTNRAAERVQYVVQRIALGSYAPDWATIPTSVNNHGEVAGWAINDAGEAVAFVRSPRGRYARIAGDAVPQDMNDRGQVVGLQYPCGPDGCSVEGFSWTRRRGLESLGTFLPLAVNDRGDMAGVCSSPWRACVMRGGVVLPVGPDGSEAHGLNKRGDVVGTHGDNQAFLLTRHWQFIDLGRASAEDINDKGTIAGHRWTDFGARGERALLTAWVNQRERSPRREVSVAVAINNKHWIVANAWDDDEQPYSFAWNAVTKARVPLKGRTGEFVTIEDINDLGDVVGTAGVRAVMWRIRAKDDSGRDDR